MAERDWRAWHAAYDQPGSSLAQRLAVVQARTADALDAAPPGPLRVISMCAGQGRDLIPVLSRHPRGPDVTALLVERDPQLAGAAREAARAAGLDRVAVATGDAGVTGAYAGYVPAHLALVCGVFGNISDADIAGTIGCLSRLCSVGGAVIWTRHRSLDGDKVPQICGLFAAEGFEQVWLSDPGQRYGVGVHVFAGRPEAAGPAARMFTFIR